jgi:hypothetical protein
VVAVAVQKRRDRIRCQLREFWQALKKASTVGLGRPDSHFPGLPERGRLSAVLLTGAEIDTEAEHLGRGVCRRCEVDRALPRPMGLSVISGVTRRAQVGVFLITSRHQTTKAICFGPTSVFCRCGCWKKVKAAGQSPELPEGKATREA